MKLNTLSNSELNIIMPLLKAELTARYFYEIAYSWSLSNSYSNAAKYYKEQANEENEHYNKWLEFVSNWVSNIDFPNIEKPSYAINSLIDVLTYQYELEYNLLKQYESACIDAYQYQNLLIKLQEFVSVQNTSVIESNDLCTGALKYLSIDPNLVLFEKEFFN